MSHPLAEGLRSGLAELQLDLSPAQQQCLLDYADWLLKWNRVYNLSALRQPQQVLTHHLLDSLAVCTPVRRQLAALGLAQRAQVIDPVPFEQPIGVVEQGLLLCRAQAQLQGVQAVAQARGERVAHAAPVAAKSRLRLRLRWISSSEIAAGVTPDMRAAWPSVSGRCFESFCRTSMLKAVTWW